MGKIKSDKVNYAIPGEPMTQKEFEERIKKAEKGPFHSMDVLQANFEKWKVKYAK